MKRQVYSSDYVLVLVVATLGILAVAAGALYLYFSKSENQILQNEVRFESLNAEIQKLDETLTMSAKMAAATGNPLWEVRYNHYDPILAKAIRALNQEFPDFKLGSQTDSANQSLVRMERRSFELEKMGQRKMALALLLSKEYETQKQIYTSGIENARLALIQAHSKRLAHASFASKAFGITMGSFLVICLFLCLVLFRRIKQQNESLEAFTKNLEQKVQETSQQLVQASKLALLGEMSAGIAHEINNPLAIIDGTINLFPRFLNDPEKIKSKVEVIRKCCLRISKIISGLKKFSRSGDKVEYSLHSLDTIAKEAVVLTEIQSKRHSVLVSVIVEHETNPSILCNEVEIEQVLINLINNAIDAVKDNVEKWVQVFIFQDQEYVVLRVTDSGNGIPEAVRKKLFEPFFTTKEVGSGTGLGLSISKGILDEHGATIDVVSDCSNTRFEIRFSKVNG